MPSSKKRALKIIDLFCGAGGTSTGAIEAGEAAGYEVTLTAVNHWDIAIATHRANHPGSRHLCTGVDDIPCSLFQPDELDILWASPECTHHSIARGGMPVNDQSRATAWCVVRFAEKWRPRIILVENVKEFQTWGPIGSNGKPLASRRGETFHAWRQSLQSIGYRVEHRVLCAADFGDPTTRERLFVYAVRGRRRIVWPEPTHAASPNLPPEQPGLNLGGPRLPWVPAREIINWDKPGRSIFTRKRPLKEKTLRRILVGLEKYCFGSFVIPPQAFDERVRGTEVPRQPSTNESGGIGPAKPFLVPHFGERDGQTPRTRSVDDPLPAVTGQGAGSLVTPFLLPNEGVHGGNAPRPVSQPVPTVTAGRGAGALVEACLVQLRGTCERHVAGSGRSVDEPVPTVSAGGGHHALAQAVLLGQQSCAAARPLEQPAPTVATAGAISLAQSVIVPIDHRGAPGHATPESAPLSTVTSKQRHGIAQARITPASAGTSTFLVETAHGDDSKSGSNSRVRSMADPMPTIAGQRGGWAKADACLIKFYGTATGASVHEPLDTVTTKDRFGLAEILLRHASQANGTPPILEIHGQRYQFDVLFRMLDEREIARAQGFPDTYQFTGTKTQIVKQIGNAVPRRLARALVAAALSQLTPAA